MTGLLKVTPEKLIAASNEFSTTGRTVRSLTQEMNDIVSSLKSVWMGEAATGYGAKFAELSDDIEKINRMIQEHVTDLNNMAREYQAAEDTNTEQSAMLKTDIVA
ncbi:MAG: WXG100 family type VII secretion target [Lachnospiraceae bacterium]|nr:WXG100 family type VII secretion target [Lachnospiraceae bacterium]MBR6485508.1 WXG100 family type VII secretion target [Lachnospiraceae bacterium]